MGRVLYMSTTIHLDGEVPDGITVILRLWVSKPQNETEPPEKATEWQPSSRKCFLSDSDAVATPVGSPNHVCCKN